jgi:uracil-DNA glycosylase
MTLFDEQETATAKQEIAELGLSFPDGWLSAISTQAISPLVETMTKVVEEYNQKTCYPALSNVFQAYEDLKPEQVRIVIIGQDPYPAPAGQAIGRAFACGVNISPSIEGINTALYANRQPEITTLTMDLQHWVNQGVFLLNTALTVEKEKPNSHASIGWDVLIKDTIRILSAKHYPMVWMLWGQHAGNFRSLITNTRHLVLRAEHPVAAIRANRNWNCDHFTRANEYFKNLNYPTIYW